MMGLEDLSAPEEIEEEAASADLRLCSFLRALVEKIETSSPEDNMQILVGGMFIQGHVTIEEDMIVITSEKAQPWRVHLRAVQAFS